MVLGECERINPQSIVARHTDYSINNLLIADRQTPVLIGGLLRPDLTSFKKSLPVGEVYEIKPESWYGVTSGEAQLAGYLYLLNRHDPARAFIPGVSWTPPSEVDLGGGVKAVVREPLAGVIYYWVRDDAMDKAIDATAAVGSLLAGQEQPGRRWWPGSASETKCLSTNAISSGARCNGRGKSHRTSRHSAPWTDRLHGACSRPF